MLPLTFLYPLQMMLLSLMMTMFFFSHLHTLHMNRQINSFQKKESIFWETDEETWTKNRKKNHLYLFAFFSPLKLRDSTKRCTYTKSNNVISSFLLFIYLRLYSPERLLVWLVCSMYFLLATQKLHKANKESWMKKRRGEKCLKGSMLNIFLRFFAKGKSKIHIKEKNLFMFVLLGDCENTLSAILGK